MSIEKVVRKENVNLYFGLQSRYQTSFLTIKNRSEFTIPLPRNLRSVYN